MRILLTKKFSIRIIIDCNRFGWWFKVGYLLIDGNWPKKIAKAFDETLWFGEMKGRYGLTNNSLSQSSGSNIQKN